MQESPGLNPDWFWDIKLFSVKTLNIMSYNNLSNILFETGSKEMERYFFTSCLCFFFFFLDRNYIGVFPF